MERTEAAGETGVSTVLGDDVAPGHFGIHCAASTLLVVSLGGVDELAHGRVSARLHGDRDHLHVVRLPLQVDDHTVTELLGSRAVRACLLRSTPAGSSST